MADLKTRILVVDDDQRLRELLTRYLGEQNFEVRAVRDAQEMDKYLARERYDLMVLDLMLPGEDGLAVCRRLRAAGGSPAIIMLTAKGDEVDRIVGLERGADDYLPKPFNPRELVARIQAVLRRKPRAGLPGAPDAFLRNRGDGRFEERSEAAGAIDRERYFGLGVVAADLDGDRDADLYVANDATPNLLFVNRGDGRFDERELSRIVGPAYVSNQPEERFIYSRDPGTMEPREPDFVVLPATTDEVQKFVLLANRKKVPLVPMGGGLVLSGLSRPLKGGIVLDLKRMNRILEVNEKSRYVLVEAGTSQGMLQAYLKKHHPGLKHSIPDSPPMATIAGNVLIHGSGHLSHAAGFHSDMLNGLEVVLPTGEVVKIGSCSVSPYWFGRAPSRLGRALPGVVRDDGSGDETVH